MGQTQPGLISFLQAKPEDSKELASLAKNIWRQHFTPIIGNKQVDYMLENFQSAAAIEKFIKNAYQYFFINLNGTPVGYLAIHNRIDHLHLSKFYLLENHRGKGIGKKALSFIIAQTKNQQLRSIRLVVNKDNQNTINIYKKLGFKIISSPVTNIGGGFVMDDYEFELLMDSI